MLISAIIYFASRFFLFKRGFFMENAATCIGLFKSEKVLWPFSVSDDQGIPDQTEKV